MEERAIVWVADHLERGASRDELLRRLTEKGWKDPALLVIAGGLLRPKRTTGQRRHAPLPAHALGLPPSPHGAPLDLGAIWRSRRLS